MAEIHPLILLPVRKGTGLIKALMVIEIKLYGPFAHYASALKEGKMNMAGNSKIVDLLQFMEIKLDTPAIILVNNRKASLTAKLEEGDIVSIIPPMGGG